MNDIEKAISTLKILFRTADEKTVEGFRLRKDIPWAISALEKQLNGGWIPVSERLPNNCGLGVLLTIENKFQQRKVIQGFTGYMEKGKLEFHTNDKTKNLEIWKVIAWQLLPEPYKEV